ncbi:UNVERIFIED_CONTAM: hypothetical protein NCL1_16968 [Trichonephila clavipes]
MARIKAMACIVGGLQRYELFASGITRYYRSILTDDEDNAVIFIIKEFYLILHLICPETKNLQQLNKCNECVQETFIVKNDPKLSFHFKYSQVEKVESLRSTGLSG